MTKVFIDGREGTTGLGIEQRLSQRPDIELLPISDALRKDPAERAKLLNQADIVFLCLPDAAAVEAVSMIKNEHTVVIDASTAHRTMPGWAYGLPELSTAHRSAIAKGKRIAVPGCHASGFIALVYPLIQAGVLPKDYPLCCHSLTGYTGGGKSMIAEYESDNRDPSLSSPREYALSQQHKHLKEMVSISGIDQAPVFCPIVADFPRGMLVTIPIHARLLEGMPDFACIYQAHYRGQRVIRYENADAPMLASNALADRDSMIISVHGHDDRIILTATYDNLGKGASGAAVQCMNIALGLIETTGLNA